MAKSFTSQSSETRDDADAKISNAMSTALSAMASFSRCVIGRRPLGTRKLYGAVAGAFVLLLVAGSASGAGGSRFPRFGAGCKRSDFKSNGALVPAEFCRTSVPGGRAVVVLHGCGGFSTFDHRLATELPRLGIATLDVDYFALTRPTGTKGFCGGPGGGSSDPFPVWVRVAQDAAAALRTMNGVNAHGVGVVGWSMGGGVALAAALGTPQQRRFDAVAGFSTRGEENGSTARVALPPTILLSGGRTDAIPLAQTLPLYRALRRSHIPSALYVYPHGSHNWPARQGTLGIEHAARFLRRYLR